MSAGLSLRSKMTVLNGRPLRYLMTDDEFPFDEHLLEDYIKEIQKVPRLREIDLKKEEWYERNVLATCYWRHKLQVRL